MAIVDIHISRMKIFETIEEEYYNAYPYEDIHLFRIIQTMNYLMNTSAGVYSANTGRVLLFLETISYCCIENRLDFYDMICKTLSHEEMHRWLLHNESFEAFKKFDNIAHKTYLQG
jgi:hypothetical protein